MIWFTSDQHFDHANVIKYCNRPFGDIEEMRHILIYNFNHVVGPDDETYHLGDFSLAQAPVTNYLPLLNGTHHLIPGNHDHVHPLHHKNRPGREERMKSIYSGFQTIDLEVDFLLCPTDGRPLDGNLVTLHHMPYSGDHTEDGERYAEWRPRDRGKWLLHGHVHNEWKIKGRMINVGVDVWNYKPVSLDLIREIIRNA